MAERCFLLAEGATSGTMALKGRGHKTHWTEEQIAQVWGVTRKTARGHLRVLKELGLLGFFRGNKRLAAERWLLLPERDRPPTNWPWGAFSSLSNSASGVEADTATTQVELGSETHADYSSQEPSGVIERSELGNFGPSEQAELGPPEPTHYPTVRSNVSLAEPIGSRHGVPVRLGVSSVARSTDVVLGEETTASTGADDYQETQERDREVRGQAVLLDQAQLAQLRDLAPRERLRSAIHVMNAELGVDITRYSQLTVEHARWLKDHLAGLREADS